MDEELNVYRVEIRFRTSEEDVIAENHEEAIEIAKDRFFDSFPDLVCVEQRIEFDAFYLQTEKEYNDE